MPITTVDGITTGLRVPFAYAKAGVLASGQPVSGIRGYTDWFAAGTPEASTATSIGVNGEAVTPALASVASSIRRTNPTSGNGYLARLQAKRGAANSLSPGAIMLVDRLWQNSGLSTTLTTAQAITPATLPARDRNASTNGDGVMAAIEWSALAGAGSPTVTLTYTNQAGTAGQTAALTANSNTGAGSWEIFPLAAGDMGIRAPTSFIQSATRTLGTQHLVLFRTIAIIPVDGLGRDAISDSIQLAMPRIYDDSVLQLIWLPAAGFNAGISAQYLETQG